MRARRILRDLLEVIEDEGGYARNAQDLPRAVAQLAADQFSNGLQVGYDEAMLERQHCDLDEIKRLLSEADAVLRHLSQTLRALEHVASGVVLE